MLVTTSGPTLIRHLQVILVRSLKIDKQRLNAHHGQLLRSHSEPAHNLPRLSDQYSFCRKYYEPLMQSEYPQQQMVSIEDRKSTRLNSSHVRISYAVFCLKKKNTRSVPPRARSRLLAILPTLISFFTTALSTTRTVSITTSPGVTRTASTQCRSPCASPSA